MTLGTYSPRLRADINRYLLTSSRAAACRFDYCVVDGEKVDDAIEFGGLDFRLLHARIGLLDQRCIVLRHLVELPNGGVDLVDGPGLVAAVAGDRRHQRVGAARRLHHRPELLGGLGDKAWCNGHAYTLADIAVGCTLGYLDFRFAHIDWRDSYPNLAKLYEKLSARPSFAPSGGSPHAPSTFT